MTMDEAKKEQSIGRGAKCSAIAAMSQSEAWQSKVVRPRRIGTQRNVRSRQQGTPLREIGDRSLWRRLGGGD
jgi:hypothetical protein